MTRTLLACLALAVGPGCMKKSGESAAPSYAGGDMAMEGGNVLYDFDESVAEEADYGGGEREMAPAPPMEPEAEPSMGVKAKRLDDDRGIAPGAAKPAPAKNAAGSGPEAKPADEHKPPEKATRQIIYTAELRLSVFKVNEVMAEIESLALAVDGYVQQMREGYYVLRIPAASLRDVMDGVSGLGMVTQRSLQARDVTEEFVDLTTRIRVLRDTQNQLLELLKRAKTVEEALHVRQALDTVTMELEQALGRLRMLENLIGFSTLTVYVDERGPQNDIPSSNDPFPWVDSLGVEATEWN
ncbi:MAG: DUF4349 domain-containing protein [Nannocystaceae bacterium]